MLFAAERAEIGGDILGLVTSGMYDTPLASVREYVQNSADAYASVGNFHGKLEVHTDVANLRLTIRDYGPGLSADEAIIALLPIARSQKILGLHRGFRGIGRLSGLAFADSVKFVTRNETSEHAFSVTWDGACLREKVAQGELASSAIKHSVSCMSIDAEEYPQTFFEVQIEGIARHAAPHLLNRERLRRYVAEVCPVPFGNKFPFSTEVAKYLGERERIMELQVHVDGEPNRIERGFTGSFKVSESREDLCRYIEFIEVPSIDGRGSAAAGWFAHSSYLGAIHKTAGIRGIRARVGNIQVGDESTMDLLFDESRFNRWCIGEIHILDRRILPNARRDYFEPNPHLRNLESKLAPHLKRLSAQCRQASRERIHNRKLAGQLDAIDDCHKLAESNLADRNLALEVCTNAIDRITKLRSRLESLEEPDAEMEARARASENALLALKCDIERSRLDDSNGASSQLAQSIFRTLARHLKSDVQAAQVVEEVMKDMLPQ